MADTDIIPFERVVNGAIGPAHPGFIAFCQQRPAEPGHSWRTGLFQARARTGALTLYGHALVRDAA